MNNGPEVSQAADELASSGQGETSLEPALRQALGRRAAPSGFADRVMARAARGEAPSVNAPAQQDRGLLRHWPASRAWARGAIAAGLLLGALESESLYRRFREQQRRIAEATAQFQTTERVTVRALAQAREQLQRAGVPLSFD